MKSNLYFKHDIYAVENDEGLRYVCSEYPVWGEAVFFRAVSIMHRKSGEPCVFRILASDIAHELYTDNKDKVSEILNTLIEVEVFKKTEDGKVYSSRVQRECEKRAEFAEKQKRNIEKRWSKDTDSTPVENQSDTSGIPMEYQGKYGGNTNKQEQEQDKERVELSNDNSPRKKVCSTDVPFSEIQGKWNESCNRSGLPKCTKLSEKRHTAIRALWLEFGDKVYSAIDKVAESDFLSGRDGKWRGCGFDWLFIKGNMLKVLEGNYDNRTSSRDFKKDVTGRYDNLESEVIEV